MENNNFNEFDETKIRRRNLLPWWIKFFCWLFMFASVLALVRIVLSFFDINTEFEFYGFNANNNSTYGIIIFIVFALHGVTAYSLWFEKKHAILLAQIDAILGVFLCIISMYLSFRNGESTLRAEIILLVLFLFKLNRIKKSWIQATDNNSIE